MTAELNEYNLLMCLSKLGTLKFRMEIYISINFIINLRIYQL